MLKKGEMICPMLFSASVPYVAINKQIFKAQQYCEQTDLVNGRGELRLYMISAIPGR